MSEPIKVGDLVQVVHSCCGDFLGAISVVESFNALPVNAKCTSCGSREALGLHKVRLAGTSPPEAPIAWLKRIPPLSELEKSQTTDDLDIREPA